jgi:5'-phosphate synthase pdxT subunit
MIIGVLALQGAFAKHLAMLKDLGVQTKEVRKPEELDSCHGLIIPGGESTTMKRQIDYIQLSDKLQEFSKKKPIFGTCAGLILMSKEIVGKEYFTPFGLLDIAVERNAFGRQADSFHADVELNLEPKQTQTFPALFIRAPRIKSYQSEVKVLASFQGEPVLVEQGIHLGSTFHPELTGNHVIHAYFLKKVSG